jgi:hypothetical protein
MEVIVYTVPPQEAPRQVTAYVRPENLYEHLLAFLNFNNPSGFPPVELAELDKNTIGGILLALTDKNELSKKSLSAYAKKIKVVSCGALSHSNALELLAILFGYSHYHYAQIDMRNNHGILVNLRKQHLDNADVYHIPTLPAKTRRSSNTPGRKLSKAGATSGPN